MLPLLSIFRTTSGDCGLASGTLTLFLTLWRGFVCANQSTYEYTLQSAPLGFSVQYISCNTSIYVRNIPALQTVVYSYKRCILAFPHFIFRPTGITRAAGYFLFLVHIINEISYKQKDSDSNPHNPRITNKSSPIDDHALPNPKPQESSYAKTVYYSSNNDDYVECELLIIGMVDPLWSSN